MTGHADRNKQRLLTTLDENISSASSLQAKAQEIVENATLSHALACAFRPIVEAAPDDSAWSEETWKRLTAAWQANNEQFRTISSSLDQDSTVSATTQAAALTTATTARVMEGWVTKPNEADIAALTAVLHRPNLFDEVTSAMRRFGLDVPHPGRAPIELIEEARVALVRPGAATPAPATVLIPARESILSTLAGLLRRLTKQGRVPRVLDKVAFIGEQAGLTGLKPEHFRRIGGEVETLLKRLSEGKQAQMASTEVSGLFDDALGVHRAFLASLDVGKFKPVKERQGREGGRGGHDYTASRSAASGSNPAFS